MARIAIIRIPSRIDEFNIPGDDLLIGESGELSVLKYEDPDDTDTVRVMAVFSSYEYAYLEDDGEEDEDDEDELERALRIAQIHGYLIDPGDEDDDEDDEDEEDDDEEEEDEASGVLTVADISSFSANGHGESPDAVSDSVLVPVDVAAPPADDASGPAAPPASLS